MHDFNLTNNGPQNHSVHVGKNRRVINNRKKYN